MWLNLDNMDKTEMRKDLEQLRKAQKKIKETQDLLNSVDQDFYDSQVDAYENTLASQKKQQRQQMLAQISHRKFKEHVNSFVQTLDNLQDTGLRYVSHPRSHI